MDRCTHVASHEEICRLSPPAACRYMPILPMVLVNGAEGIGTGWSTYIPNYNPRDIIANLRRLLAGEAVQPMQPWYRGFKGTIQETLSKTAGKSYSVYGTIAQVRLALSPVLLVKFCRLRERQVRGLVNLLLVSSLLQMTSIILQADSAS